MGTSVSASWKGRAWGVFMAVRVSTVGEGGGKYSSLRKDGIGRAGGVIAWSDWG